MAGTTRASSPAIPRRRGPEGQATPNITPDNATGIGDWTEEQIATYLGTGKRPDGDVAGGLMEEGIQGTLGGLQGYDEGRSGGYRAVSQEHPGGDEQDRVAGQDMSNVEEAR